MIIIQIGSGTSLKRFKGVCVIPDIKPWDFINLINDHSKRLAWDTSIKNVNSIHIEDNEEG